MYTGKMKSVWDHFYDACGVDLAKSSIRNALNINKRARKVVARKHMETWLRKYNPTTEERKLVTEAIAIIDQRYPEFYQRNKEPVMAVGTPELKPVKVELGMNRKALKMARHRGKRTRRQKNPILKMTSKNVNKDGGTATFQLSPFAKNTILVDDIISEGRHLIEQEREGEEIQRLLSVKVDGEDVWRSVKSFDSKAKLNVRGFARRRKFDIVFTYLRSMVGVTKKQETAVDITGDTATETIIKVEEPDDDSRYNTEKYTRFTRRQARPWKRHPKPKKMHTGDRDLYSCPVCYEPHFNKVEDGCNVIQCRNCGGRGDPNGSQNRSFCKVCCKEIKEKSKSGDPFHKECGHYPTEEQLTQQRLRREREAKEDADAKSNRRQE